MALHGVFRWWSYESSWNFFDADPCTLSHVHVSGQNPILGDATGDTLDPSACGAAYAALLGNHMGTV